ncbi:MAG: sensor histidine kinase [Anaerolineae bacterium]|nr:sensor histidine kinase [Anaerolineae bacterium]
MRDAAPEPGFIPAYRFFLLIRILFWLAVGPVLILLQLAGDPAVNGDPVLGERLIRNLSLPNVAPLLIVDVLVLAMLTRPLEERLGRWFVPLTLGLGLAPLLVGYYLWPAVNPLQSPFVMFFFVSAMLVAWEYKYRYLYVFVFALTVYQTLVSPWSDNIPWTVPAGFLVLQAVMMVLAGSVTATLATVQAAQRTALSEAYQKQADANQRLQQYAATLEELAISRERNRLARELHDTLAHSLSAVTVQLEAVRSLWPKRPDKALEMLERADDTARTGLAEARRALQALRAVRELAENAAERTGARLDLHMPESVAGCLPDEVEQGVYRIAQESLENVVRHAGATALRIELAQSRGELKLSVQDDGQGMEADPTAQAGDAGLGIRGMQERAALIGAELEITSEAGSGTRIVLTVPLERNSDDPCPDL